MCLLNTYNLVQILMISSSNIRLRQKVRVLEALLIIDWVLTSYYLDGPAMVGTQLWTE